MRKPLAVLLLPLVSLNVFAADATVTSLNLEWLWYDRSRHEGRVIGLGNDSDPGDTEPPTAEKYKANTVSIANIINASGANIVGLVEIEGEQVVKDLRNTLGSIWRYTFKKGGGVSSFRAFDMNGISDHRTVLDC